MKHLTQTTELDSGDVIFSASFQFTPAEMAGAFALSDDPDNTSIQALEDLSDNPEVLLSFLRIFIHQVSLVNSRGHPGTEAVIEHSMGTRRSTRRVKKKRRKKNGRLK